MIKRWNKLAGLPLLKEGSEWHDDKHETLADRKYSDALDAEEAANKHRDAEILLDELEQGKDVRMSEEEYEAVKDLCRNEGLDDYVFDTQNYKDLKIVRLQDDYDDYNRW